LRPSFVFFRKVSGSNGSDSGRTDSNGNSNGSGSGSIGSDGNSNGSDCGSIGSGDGSNGSDYGSNCSACGSSDYDAGSNGKGLLFIHFSMLPFHSTMKKVRSLNGMHVFAEKIWIFWN
jgi:hypothetical protein